MLLPCKQSRGLERAMEDEQSGVDGKVSCGTLSCPAVCGAISGDKPDPFHFPGTFRHRRRLYHSEIRACSPKFSLSTMKKAFEKRSA